MLPEYAYDLFDLKDIKEVERLFKVPNLAGFNVTIPYKEEILPYLHHLSEEAAAVGAVNCVSITNGIRTGYNTDVAGFEKTLLLHAASGHSPALILGAGGAAKAVAFVLRQHQIPYKTVSRKGSLTFGDLTAEMVNSHKLIIQCTPVGTFPAVSETLPFPFEGLTAQHLVLDLIYNPTVTAFLERSAAFGAKTANGFYMLEQQAEKSWQIWAVNKK